MSKVIIKEAVVFCETDPATPCGLITVAGETPDFYRAVNVAGPNSVEQRFDSFDEAVAHCVAHADAIDSTDVSDKATRLDYERRIAAKNDELAAKEAELVAKDEEIVKLRLERDQKAAEAEAAVGVAVPIKG